MEAFNDRDSARGEFLHVSGMRVTYDVTKESGSRVQQVLIRDTNNPVGGMRELNVDQIYQIGMPSFISSGAGRFTFMRSIPSQIIPDAYDISVLAMYMKSLNAVYCGVEKRIQFVEPPASVDVTGTVFLTIFLTLLFSGIVIVMWKYVYPRIKERRGSMLPLIR